ncbi:MAG: hypothetical protein K2J80_02115 [Oscillospiraceae bacterium]|nr:hypothetical protein [Oscillospiraceae bacterium]
MIDTEEKARKKVNDTWAADELFIVLSESQYQNGHSVPRMFKVSESDISLGIFTTYEAAADFCTSERYIRDGKLLIGRIDNTDKLRDLYSILNTAVHMGATWTDIDCGTEDAIHINLRALFEWGGRQFGNISMLMSKEEFERVQAGRKLNLHFNSMPLYES